MNTIKQKYPAFLFIAMLIVAVSCSDSNNPLSTSPEADTQVSSSTKPVAINMQMATSGSTTSKSRTSANTNSNVVLEEAKFLVKRLNVNSIEDDSLNFLKRNLIVDLPLDGSPFILSSDGIPNGMYDELKVQVHKPRGNQTTEDPDFVEGEQRFSIVLRGTSNGEAFTFKSDENFNFDFDFNPPIEITDSTTSVSIDLMVNTEAWFTAEDGSALDPSNPDHFDEIEDNIEDSFEAREEIEDREDRRRDNDDRKSGREFEQQVVSVDVTANTFTLRGDITVQLTDSTAIRADGDLFSLQEVLRALNNGIEVEAEGRATQQSTDAEVDFIAHVVKFETEEDDDDRDEEDRQNGREFDQLVVSVDVTANTFTLRGDVTVQITDSTTIRQDGDLLSLQEVQSTLRNNTQVEAEGRADKANDSTEVDLIARVVKFETEDEEKN